MKIGRQFRGLRLSAPSLITRRLTPLGSPVVLFLWCVFLFGYGLSTGTLYRTEALRALIGREALNGSWIVPTLYGEPFLTKPPGMYLAIAACSAPFGEVTAVSARLPSVIAATLVVFLFYFTFAQVFERRLALLGAMLMPVSALWLDKAPSAEIDMLQVFWVAAAILFMHRALEPANSSPTTWWLLSFLCVAGGFLTKWTAPAFFYLTLVPYLAWRGKLSFLWSWRHLAGIGLVMGIVGLWVTAVVDRVGWPILRDTVLAEATQRFAPHHGGRSYPWLESLSYPFMILIANLPWSIGALWTLRPSFIRSLNEPSQRLLILFHCWTWPNLLFWALPAQHHVRYSLPMCPGLIGLGVMVALQSLRCAKPSSRGFTRAVGATLVLWVVVKIAYVEFILPPRTATRQVRETAGRIAELVPPNEVLYLGRLKDEGIMFYYNRPARRMAEATSPVYALLLEAEWQALAATRPLEVIERLRDQQGAPIVLVRLP